MSDANYLVGQLWLAAAFVVSADGQWTLCWVALIPAASAMYRWWRAEQ